MKRDYNKLAIESLINDEVVIGVEPESGDYTKEIQSREYGAYITVYCEVGGTALAETYLNPAEVDYWVDHFEITEIYMTNKLGEEMELTKEQISQIEKSLNVIV